MRSTPSGFSRFAFILALGLSPAIWLANYSPDAEAAVSREVSVAQGAAFYLGGAFVGTVSSAAGGAAVASVIEEPGARGTLPKKHVGAVSYEPIRVELGLGVERTVFEWIDASWKGAAQPRSGSLVSVSHNQDALGGSEFTNAVIAETTIPACDASSSKEAGNITLELSPERVSVLPASGAKVAQLSGKAKAWIPSNFRLEIDGLDASRVIRVSPIVVKQALAATEIGTGRQPTQKAGALSVSNLRVTLPEASADSWRKWHDDFVLKANAGDKQEKAGRLVLLAQNLKDELATIELGHLGIVALRSLTTESGVQRVEAELYVESVALSLAAGK